MDTPTQHAKVVTSTELSSHNVDQGLARPFMIAATSHQGLIVETACGQRAKLVVLDENGILLSDDVAREVWHVCVHTYRNFLLGTGHLKVIAGPPESPGEYVAPTTCKNRVAA